MNGSTRLTRTRLLTLQLATASMVALISSPAWSQQTVATTPQVDAQQSQANPASPPAADANDIVVTALKRGTVLQNTPISISAITPQALANSGAQSIADLASKVPGLNFVDAGPSNRRVVIRGIYATGEPTVGVYYDETPVTGVIGASNDAAGSTPELRLFDVERVEVLRGPQGTLYGSGSMGGTLRIIYKKPTDRWEGAVDGQISDTDHGGVNGEINGALNVPIVSDKVDLRVVGTYRNNSGYIDNTYLHINNINNERVYGGRALLRMRPASRLTIDLAAYYNNSYDDTASWLLEDGKYQTDQRVRSPIKDEVQLYSGTAVYDAGFATVTGVVSYMMRNFSSVGDTSRYIQGSATAVRYAAFCGTGNCTNPNYVQPGAPGVPVGGITSYAQYLAYVGAQSTSALFPQQSLDALTAELRLTGSIMHSINWTVGGFYSDRTTDVANPQVNADPVTGVLLPDQVDTERLIHDELKQEAIFADLSWDITSKLNITGGIRYFDYQRDVSGQTPVPSILVGAVVTPLTLRNSSEDGEVFKANASYKFTRDFMLYFNAAQGFRPGGVNQTLGLATSLQPYESDSLWNYEVGMKLQALHRKVTLNADVFRIDWSNIQVSGQTPNGAFSFITNAGAARIQGVEVDTTILPVTGLTLQGNLAYMDPRLTVDQTNNQVRAPGLKGDRIPYVPEITAGASAQYSWPLTENFNGFLRADYSHIGDSYSDFRPPATYTRYIPATDLVNARVGIEAPDGRWGVYLFANNLFDATAILRASSSAIGVGLTSVTTARPRTVGLNFRKTF
jgi:iron complex outermembrane recepter protein